MSHVDWEKWDRMKSVRLWEAIALAHGQEPRDTSIKCAYTSDFCGNQTLNYDCKEGFNDPNLQRTLEIAKSYIDTPDCFKIYKVSEFYPLEMIVDLTAFGTWYLTLPEGFPKTHPAEALGHVITGLPYTTTHLEVMFEAMRIAFPDNVTDTASLRKILEQQSRSRGLSLPDPALDELAIAIRPDDACKKDRRNNRFKSIN